MWKTGTVQKKNNLKTQNVIDFFLTFLYIETNVAIQNWVLLVIKNHNSLYPRLLLLKNQPVWAIPIPDVLQRVLKI